MKISIACDHGGYDLKTELIPFLNKMGLETVDFGCFSKESMDYPDVALSCAEAVQKGEAEMGIVICTTGIGVSICANKVKGIRCALCTSSFQAEMTRRHNNANMLALGAKTVSTEEAKDIVKMFFNTSFEGGRHARRVDKIIEYDNKR